MAKYSLVDAPFNAPKFLSGLRNFYYYPWTNWERFWQGFFSPTFYFGCNVEDTEVEKQVLGEVGSYGKQLNCIMNVLSVLAPKLDDATLTPQERTFVKNFLDLSKRADEVSTEFQGKHPRDLIESDVKSFIDGMISLKKSDPSIHQKFLARIKRDLLPAGGT